MENKQNYDITRVLKTELNRRNNPTDMKSVHIGKVISLSPLTVSIYEGKVVLTENVDLYISEWFRFRCDIDKTNALSSDVPTNVNNAKNVTETHSANGSPCNMPSAITYLANAITSINTELLQLKCDLQVGDFVTIGSLEQLDRFILLDKVLGEN